MGCHHCGENHGTAHYFEVCAPAYQAEQADIGPMGRLRHDIAEIEDDIEYGIASEKDMLRLQDKKQELLEMTLDAERPSGLSTERLDMFESEQRCINRELTALGLEIAEARGEPLQNASLDSYERTTADDWAYREYPMGTRLLVLYYRIAHQRYEPEYRTIVFPESYLGEDWKPIEAAALEAKQTEVAAQAAAAERDREARERAQLAALKAKYGEAK
jgi:hypothetical protein